jgi:CRP-like cAMP-binding protein
MTALSLIGLAAGVWIGLAVILIIVAVAAWVAFRMTYSEHLPDLSAVPLFEALNKDQIRSVARVAARVGYGPGDQIVAAGDRGKGFFLIREGTVSILVDEHEAGTLGAGGYFGEIALLDGAPRSAGVVAKTATSVLEVPTSGFNRLLEQDSSIGQAIYAGLQQRLGDKAHPPSGRVTKDQLVELCQRVRETEKPDWGQTH